MSVETEVRTPETEQIMGSDIGQAITDMLDKPFEAPTEEPKEAPAEKPKEAPTEEPKEAPTEKPKETPAEDLLTPESLAQQAKTKEGDLPDDLLKEDEIDKLPEKKQREAFAKERAAHKQARQRLQELSDKVNELSSKAQDAEQVQELRQQIEQKDSELKKISDEMAKIDLTRSPEFKKQYDDRMNQVGQKMVKTLVDEGVEQSEAVQLIRSLVAETKPSVREATLDEAAPGLKGTLIAYLNQFDEVSQARGLALEKARETAASIDEAETRGRLASLSGRVDEVTDRAVKDAVALGSPFYKKVEGDEYKEWNDSVDQRIAALKGSLLNPDLDKLAPLVAEGLTAADLRNRYAGLLKQYRTLETEYKEVVGQAPGLGQNPTPQAQPPSQKKELTLGSGDIQSEVESMLDRM